MDEMAGGGLSIVIAAEADSPSDAETEIVTWLFVGGWSGAV